MYKLILDNIKKLKNIIKNQNKNFMQIMEEEKRLLKELEELGIEESGKDSNITIELLSKKIENNNIELEILSLIEEEFKKFKNIDFLFEDEILNKRFSLLKKILYLNYNNNIFELLILSKYGLYYIYNNNNEIKIINLSTKKNGYHIFDNGEICDGSWLDLFKKINEYSILTFIEMFSIFLESDDKKYHLAHKNFNKEFLKTLNNENKILVLKEKLNKIKNKKIKEFLNEKDFIKII